MKVSVSGKQVELLDTHYKAEGGQAKIYVRDGVAYKIFHEPKKMIPAAKIRELAQIKLPNVLAPQQVIQDKNGQDVGFTMPSASDFEFLCKLFSKGFRNRNKLTPQDIVFVVRELQTTLQKIHALGGYLVVDFNEMNFLVDGKVFKTPFFIDVDSYQTPSFPASALMESVRDRQVKANKFTELSDWFSFAVVAFKLYIGTHPYGGVHPNFGGEGVLNDRMDKNVSVFDPAIQLPGSCQDFGVIPQPHMDWFRRVFVNGERSIPPLPDGAIAIAGAVARIIAGNERFTATLEADFLNDILGIDVIAGSRFYLTDGGVYQEKTEVLKFSTRDKIRGILPVAGSSFAIAEYNKPTGTVLFCDNKKNKIGETAGDGFTVVNGCVYTISNGNFVESSFINLGNGPVHQTLIVGTVFSPTAKLFQGVAIQDMLGRAYAVIPFQKGMAMSLALPELNGYRIIDAKYEKTFLVVIGERGGDYYRFVFKFDPKSLKYSVRVSSKVDMDVVSFTVLANGLCIMTVNDKQVEAFFGTASVKTVQRPPFDSEDSLYSEGNVAMVIKGSKLYKITLK